MHPETGVRSSVQSQSWGETEWMLGWKQLEKLGNQKMKVRCKDGACAQ